ncbi:MAG: hypothetical protein R3D33_02465 [Hyphomicrobiaceae bacterium]
MRRNHQWRCLPRRFAAAIVLAVAPPIAASAATFEAGGLVFSDERGGFELLGASGSGSVTDPIVITERIFADGPVVLTIRRTDLAVDATTSMTTMFSRSLVKVVRNATRQSWASFNLELQEHIGQPSVYGDGLSFDQLHTMKERPIEADRFLDVLERIEPYDRIRFTEGEVSRGDAVTMSFNVTDVTPVGEFYLVQTPEYVVVERDRRDGPWQLFATAILPKLVGRRPPSR